MWEQSHGIIRSQGVGGWRRDVGIGRNGESGNCSQVVLETKQQQQQKDSKTKQRPCMEDQCLQGAVTFEVSGKYYYQLSKSMRNTFTNLFKWWWCLLLKKSCAHTYGEPGCCREDKNSMQTEAVEIMPTMPTMSAICTMPTMSTMPPCPACPRCPPYPLCPPCSHSHHVMMPPCLPCPPCPPLISTWPSPHEVWTRSRHCSVTTSETPKDLIFKVNSIECRNKAGENLQGC